MKKQFKTSLLLSSVVGILIVSPSVVSAQIEINNGIMKVGGIINNFTSSIVQSLGSLALALAVVVFFFGIVEYIWGVRQGDGAKAKTGSMFMVWGTIALFVMFSIWGIIYFGQSIFGIEGRNDPSLINGGQRRQQQEPFAPANGAQMIGNQNNAVIELGTPAANNQSGTSAGAPGSCEGKVRFDKCGTGYTCDMGPEDMKLACYKQ